jgi:hypothetical protein
MPIVEHRIFARKIEQLRAELVEKPPMMLGLVICVRHALLRKIPVKYFFHNRTEPSRLHRSRRGLPLRTGNCGTRPIGAPPHDGMRKSADGAYWRAGPS